MAEPTKEEVEAKAKDLQKRVEGFNSELIPLLGKYELGLGAQAFITPQGIVAARPQLFDDPKKPAEAPKEGTPPAEQPKVEKPSEIVEG